MTPLRATILIAVLTVASKLLGAVRQAVFAHAFGAGQQIDIYVAAFRVPDLLFNLLILGTLSVAFIPVFVEVMNRDRAQAAVVASTIFNLTAGVMAILAVAGIFLSPYLVDILVPGFSAAAKAQTALLTRIMMLSPLLFSLSSVLTSVLQSFKRFLAAAVAPLFYNLAIIAGVVYLYPRLGLAGLAWGVSGGALLHFLIQFPGALRLGLRPFQFWAFKNAAVRKIGRLFFPRIFGIELGQISLLAASVLTSYLAVGSLAVFYFAYDLETVPLGVFAISFAIAAFPTMSEMYGKGELHSLKRFFAGTVIQVLFLMIPISVLVLILRAQIVRLILGAGSHTQFNFTDTRLTAQAMGIFALSLFAQSMVPLLARVFYAMHNTIVPVLSGLAAAVLNVILAIVLVKVLPPAQGLALAFSIAITVHMAIMYFVLHHRLRGLEDEFLLLRLIKISIASIAMAVATFTTLYVAAPLVNMGTYLGVATQTVSALIVAVLTYIGIGFLIKLPETEQLLTILKNVLFKMTRPITAALVNMFTDFR